MAKRINSQDIFEKDDIFEGIRLSAQKTIEQLNKIDQEFKQLSTTIKTTLGGAKFDSTKNINEFTKATQDASKAVEQSIKIEKLKEQATQQSLKAQQELEKLAQQKERTTQQQMRTAQQQAKEEERLNAQKEKSAKLAQNEANAYKRLEKATRDLKNESKRLGAEMLALENSGRKNTAEYRKLEMQYKAVTRSAQQGDEQLKRLDKSVGDNFRNVGNYKSALGGLQNMLGQLGIAFGISTIVRSAFGAIKEFDQGVANLASVLGTTQDKIIALSEDAKRLGSTTRFTAGQVAQLQTEFAKLGFNETEILNATESTLSLAGATGTDLARSAEVAGSTLRAFGLNASEMQRVTDVMAKSFSTSALDMESFAESMKYVAPVSKAAGVSLEETSAMLGALADNGIKGSSAGTALRRIFSEMATTGKPVKEALAEISDRGLNLTDAMDEVGRSAQTALLVLSKSQEKVGNLTETYENAEGSAKSMADTQLNTLGGALDLLSSAWEGYILKINSASGAGAGFSNALVFLSENLESIFNILFKVVKYYALYRASLVAVNTAQFIMNGGLKNIMQSFLKSIPMTRAYRLEQIQLARASKATGEAVKQSGRAMNAVPWMAIIGVVIELAQAFYDVASGAKEAREQQAITEAYNAQAQKRADKRNTDRSKDSQKQIAELQRQRNEGKITEKEFLKQKESINKTTKQAIQNDIKAVKARKEGFKSQLTEFETLQKAFNDGFMNMSKDERKRYKAVVEQHGSVENAIRSVKGSISATNTSLKAYNAEFDVVSEVVLDATSEVNAMNKSTEKTTKVTREAKSEFKDLNDYVSKYNDLLQQLVVIEQERKKLALEKEIEKEVEAQKKLVDETGNYSLEKVEQLATEKLNIEKSAIEQRRDAELKAIDDSYQYEQKTRLQDLIDERDKLLKETDGASNANQAKIEINKNFQTQLAQLDNQEIERKKDVELQKQIVVEQSTDEINALETEAFEFKVDLEKELSDAKKSYTKEALDNSKDANKKDLESLRDTESTKREIIKQTTDFMVKQSEKRVEKIDEEMRKAEQQLDYYRELSAQGNVDAQQSLAEQQRIIDEANRRKERELKRQQRIKLAESVYSTYSNKIEGGSKNPLAETIRDTTLLQQFISSLPTFFDGTEDTGKNGNGVDGKGGFHAILHPNERVVPKSLNEKIGNLSNTDLARVAQEYNNGKFVESNGQPQSALELALLVNEIKDLKSVIKDKPETNIALGQITQSVVEIVESKTIGKTTTYNRYKVRK